VPDDVLQRIESGYYRTPQTMGITTGTTTTGNTPTILGMPVIITENNAENVSITMDNVTDQLQALMAGTREITRQMRSNREAQRNANWDMNRDRLPPSDYYTQRR
jgi:hypothetical protein